MKKYLFLSAFLFAISFSFAQAQVFNVKEVGGWITVYDENGEEHSAMSSDGVILGGSGDDFFVISSPQWIHVFDMNCKEISKMSCVGKKVTGGKSFTVHTGKSIIEYDKNCRQLTAKSKTHSKR